MSEPKNARKTYMMLSEDNCEKYKVDMNGNIIREYPDNYIVKIVTKEEVDEEGDAGEEEDGGNNKKDKTVVIDVPCALFTYRFPDEFISSRNPRWIEVHHCKAIYDGHMYADMILHSDIIKRDAYLDRSVMVVNETRTKYKKYAFTTHDTEFTIWFTNFTSPKTAIEKEKLRFMVELMLIY